MIYRLLLIFALCSIQAYAQEYDYTLSTPAYTGLENIQNTQGTAANLGDDGTVGNINIGFDFEFYGETFSTVNLSSNGLISFKNIINGCCSGELLPSNQYNDFGIFGVWTDLVNIGTMNPYYKTLGEEGSKRFVVGWYDQAMFYDSTQLSSFEITLFQGSNNILLSYDDINLNRAHTSGIQGYGSLGQYEQVYHGGDGNTLDYSSYLFTYSATEPPPKEPETPIAPDCTVNPSDTSCVINNIVDTDFTDTDTEIYAEINDSFIDQSESMNESFADNTEQMSSQQDTIEQVVGMPEEITVAEIPQPNDIQDLVNEEVAEQLADNIDANVLDIVLSIVEQTSSIVADNNISNASNNTSSNISIASNDDNSGSNSSAIDQQDQQISDNGLSQAEELLATGVSLNNMSLDNLQNNIDQSIEQSYELENMTVNNAMQSLDDSIEMSKEGFQQLLDSTQQDTSSNDNLSEITEIIAEVTVDIEANIEENLVSVYSNESPQQESIQNIGDNLDMYTELSSDIGNTIEDDMMSTTEIDNIETDIETSFEEQLVNNIIENSNKTFLDESNNFNDVVEQAVIYNPNDNLMMGVLNVTNLELAGVLQPNVEKSDAEKRAEEVIAANQAEQDAINADYMNADQAGIVAAIGNNTDVTAYRTLMLPDNNLWYRAEDIYKNVVYRDNVRGSYFLEKGNTDTYKKMVDEQYK